MNNKIKCNVYGKECTLIINKFKAIESLDFILDMINFLPENIILPNTEQTLLSKDTIKYIIFMIMDVGETVEITEEQKSMISELKEMNLIKLIIKEAYLNSNNDDRAYIREQLFSLLKFEQGNITGEIDTYFKTNKSIFNALIKIMEFNYNDFFLMTDI